MIYIDRSRVPMPDMLQASNFGGVERREAEKFYSAKTRNQQRFLFRAMRHPEVRGALIDLFFNKCAYCESPLSVVAGDVELYRPKGAVSESPTHPGYWWLAMDWTNLFIACPDCNRVRRHNLTRDDGGVSGKGNRFPLLNEAVRCFRPQDDITLEQPMLLNPCIDDPDEHLVFDWNGLAASDTLRGQTTIMVLGLNRSSLVDARAREAQMFRFILDHADLDDLDTPSARALTTELKAVATGATAYAGMKRQLLRRARAELNFGGEQDKAPISMARRKRAWRALQHFEQEQSAYTLSNEAGRRIARSQQRRIEHISIRNFKGLRNIEIEVTGRGDGAGWLMLLGENSTGKSSVLQAIALCLAGADYFATLVNKDRILPRELVNSRGRRGVISIKLSGFVAPHRMTITSSGAEFVSPSGKSAKVVLSEEQKLTVSGDEEARNGQLILLGYGATRLLPRKRPVRYGLEFSRVDNLFDPFLPLFDATEWLRGLDNTTFVGVALILKDLMSLDNDALLRRRLSRVYVSRHGDSSPLERLSDGFQSVIAMSVDILEVAIRLWGNAENAEGIVLLDEIGAHLHPSWKMKIVSSLRRAFPGIQFVATTHDPLCLRGLTEGEVVVMQRGEEGDVEPITGLPSPGDFRVDQLLTSEFFGLNSTVDPETEALFDRYYALMALDQRTSDHNLELEQLRDLLHDRRYVGDTVREQLMFEAVDKVVAQHLAGGGFSMPEMKQEAAKELAEMWDSAMSGFDEA